MGSNSSVDTSCRDSLLNLGQDDLADLIPESLDWAGFDVQVDSLDPTGLLEKGSALLNELACHKPLPSDAAMAQLGLFGFNLIDLPVVGGIDADLMGGLLNQGEYTARMEPPFQIEIPLIEIPLWGGVDFELFELRSAKFADGQILDIDASITHPYYGKFDVNLNNPFTQKLLKVIPSIPSLRDMHFPPMSIEFAQADDQSIVWDQFQLTDSLQIQGLQLGQGVHVEASGQGLHVDSVTIDTPDSVLGNLLLDDPNNPGQPLLRFSENITTRCETTFTRNSVDRFPFESLEIEGSAGDVWIGDQHFSSADDYSLTIDATPAGVYYIEFSCDQAVVKLSSAEIGNALVSSESLIKADDIFATSRNIHLTASFIDTGDSAELLDYQLGLQPNVAVNSGLTLAGNPDAQVDDIVFGCARFYAEGDFTTGVHIQQSTGCEFSGQALNGEAYVSSKNIGMSSEWNGNTLVANTYVGESTVESKDGKSLAIVPPQNVEAKLDTENKRLSYRLSPEDALYMSHRTSLGPGTEFLVEANYAFPDSVEGTVNLEPLNTDTTQEFPTDITITLSQVTEDGIVALGEATIASSALVTSTSRGLLAQTAIDMAPNHVEVTLLKDLKVGSLITLPKGQSLSVSLSGASSSLDFDLSTLSPQFTMNPSADIQISATVPPEVLAELAPVSEPVAINFTNSAPGVVVDASADLTSAQGHLRSKSGAGIPTAQTRLTVQSGDLIDFDLDVAPTAESITFEASLADGSAHVSIDGIKVKTNFDKGVTELTSPTTDVSGSVALNYIPSLDFDLNLEGKSGTVTLVPETFPNAPQPPQTYEEFIDWLGNDAQEYRHFLADNRDRFLCSIEGPAAAFMNRDLKSYIPFDLPEGFQIPRGQGNLYVHASSEIELNGSLGNILNDPLAFLASVTPDALSKLQFFWEYPNLPEAPDRVKESHPSLFLAELDTLYFTNPRTTKTVGFLGQILDIEPDEAMAIFANGQLPLDHLLQPQVFGQSFSRRELSGFLTALFGPSSSSPTSIAHSSQRAWLKLADLKNYDTRLTKANNDIPKSKDKVANTASRRFSEAPYVVEDRESDGVNLASYSVLPGANVDQVAALVSDPSSWGQRGQKGLGKWRSGYSKTRGLSDNTYAGQFLNRDYVIRVTRNQEAPGVHSVQFQDEGSSTGFDSFSGQIQLVQRRDGVLMIVEQDVDFKGEDRSRYRGKKIKTSRSSFGATLSAPIVKLIKAFKSGFKKPDNDPVTNAIVLSHIETKSASRLANRFQGKRGAAANHIAFQPLNPKATKESSQFLTLVAADDPNESYIEINTELLWLDESLSNAETNQEYFSGFLAEQLGIPLEQAQGYIDTRRVPIQDLAALPGLSGQYGRQFKPETLVSLAKLYLEGNSFISPAFRKQDLVFFWIIGDLNRHVSPWQDNTQMAARRLLPDYYELGEDNVDPGDTARSLVYQRFDETVDRDATIAGLGNVGKYDDYIPDYTYAQERSCNPDEIPQGFDRSFDLSCTDATLNAIVGFVGGTIVHTKQPVWFGNIPTAPWRNGGLLAGSQPSKAKGRFQDNDGTFIWIPEHDPKTGKQIGATVLCDRLLATSFAGELEVEGTALGKYGNFVRKVGEDESGVQLPKVKLDAKAALETVSLASLASPTSAGGDALASAGSAK